MSPAFSFSNHFHVERLRRHRSPDACRESYCYSSWSRCEFQEAEIVMHESYVMHSLKTETRWFQGAIISSILIAVISRNILLSQGQRNVNNFMHDSKLTREHKNAAAKVFVPFIWEPSASLLQVGLSVGTTLKVTALHMSSWWVAGRDACGTEWKSSQFSWIFFCQRRCKITRSSVVK